ncbi:hypothetical protein Bbelb_439840 [Branchiostoma belcheri]|nr:hypothetical protein Bbelb_439840 [Branchiostoma belcheri]
MNFRRAGTSRQARRLVCAPRIPPKSPPHYDFPATKPSTCLTSTLVRLSFMSSGYHARQFRTQKQRLKQYVPAAGVQRIGNTFHQIVIAESPLNKPPQDRLQSDFIARMFQVSVSKWNHHGHGRPADDRVGTFSTVVSFNREDYLTKHASCTPPEKQGRTDLKL